MLIRIQNQLTELTRLHEALEAFSEEEDLTPSMVFQLNLIIEELVTNTILYGYPKGEEQEISIEVRKETDLVIQVVDEGRPFDPTKAEEPLVYESIEEQPVGGLGIHFVKSFSDALTYERIDGKNVLTIIKKLPKEA